MTDLPKRIQARLAEPTLASLATITEHGKPWVRYVTAMMDNDLNVWIVTSLRSRKAAHIQNNPEVHLVCGVTSLESPEPYLQIQGRAEILTDPDLKKARWNDFLSTYFSGPNDPDYCILKINSYRIEWQGMASAPPEVWEA